MVTEPFGYLIRIFPPFSTITDSECSLNCSFDLSERNPILAVLNILNPLMFNPGTNPVGATVLP